MAKLTKQERINSVKQIGKEINFDFEISPQAEKIIANIDDFDVDHFKKWWKKNFGNVHGGHLHQYLSSADGINESKMGGN